MPNQIPAVPHLDLVNGRPVTTSLNVAQVFSKRHKNVLQAIENLAADEKNFAGLNFQPGAYPDAQGQLRPMYHMTRDGFTLLAMGFTGKEAMRFKIAYIEAFNRMEAELTGRGSGKRVDVSHSHLRLTAAPGGLDIRYSLDLTKIIMRPTQRGLELLQRVTGIDMEDLIEDVERRQGLTPAGLLRIYVDQACELVSKEERITLAALWLDYTEWFSLYGHDIAKRATRKQFAKFIGEVDGCFKVNRGGTTYVYGLRIREVQS